MEIISQEYSVFYTLSGGLVRSVAEGSFDGRSYSASVRIETSNIYDIPNDKTGGIDTIKKELAFRISCPDNKTAGLVLSFIRDKFKKRENIDIIGSVPDSNNVVRVENPIEYFLGVDMKISKKNEK